eukprot:1596-Heterococcus_DN1.PRE.4
MLRQQVQLLTLHAASHSRLELVYNLTHPNKSIAELYYTLLYIHAQGHELKGLLVQHAVYQLLRSASQYNRGKAGDQQAHASASKTR